METLELKKDKVYLGLKQDIISGRLPSGGKLPRETELARELGVGRITLRASLDRLENDGFIKRIHGKGTFVYPDNVKLKATSTIMVLHGEDSGVESPWRYIVPEISNYAAERQMKSFITTDAAMNIFSESDIREFAKSNNVIGIISVMNNFNGSEPILARMKAAGVPAVITHARSHDTDVTGFASICIPEVNVWEDSIAYLAKKGHKAIGIIGSAPSTTSTSKVRPFRHNTYEQTLDLLKKYKAAAIPEMIKTAIFDRDKIIGAVEELMNNKLKPTAILCFSDFFAVHVYDALKRMNFKIPDDVAVMGICGYPDARLLSPPLSTVDYGYAEQGRMAVEMLEHPDQWFDPVNGKGKQRIKPYKFIKRASTESKLQAVTR